MLLWCSARVSGTRRVAAAIATGVLQTVRRGSPTPPRLRPEFSNCSARVSDPAAIATGVLQLFGAGLRPRRDCDRRSPTSLTPVFNVQPSTPMDHFVLYIRRAPLRHKDYGNALARSRWRAIGRTRSRNPTREHVVLTQNRPGAPREALHPPNPDPPPSASAHAKTASVDPPAPFPLEQNDHKRYQKPKILAFDPGSDSGGANPALD